MMIHLRRDAFARYCELNPNVDEEYGRFQSKLRTEATGGLYCFTWHNQPAVYLHQAYWSYESDPRRNEVILLSCLAVLERIGAHRRAGRGLAVLQDKTGAGFVGIGRQG